MATRNNEVENEEILRSAQDDGKDKRAPRAPHPGRAATDILPKEKADGETQAAEAQPANQNEINTYLINTLTNLAESIRQSNAALAEMLEKKAAENAAVKPAASVPGSTIGAPDDYSGYAWTEKVTIRIYKGPGAMDDFFVRVNGRPFLIRRGVDVVVPLAVAEAVKIHEEQNLRTAELIRKLVAQGQQAEEELAKR